MTMVFVITDSGNSDGYGKPIAVAHSREQVEKFCRMKFQETWDKEPFSEINLTVKVGKPFGWREDAAIVKVEGIAIEGCNCVQSYEVYKVRNLVEPDAYEALDFFGE